MWIIVNKYGLRVSEPFSHEREAYNVLRKAMDVKNLKGYRLKKI